MRQHFSDFTHIEQHLDSLGLFHMDMGLDRMRRALSALGLARPSFVTVQVLGTNGKGSTASFLSSLCAAHGLRTGLYTSPHFVSPTERIRIDGRPWPQELWTSQANKVMDAAPELTYFEFLTVLALLAFAEERVDVAILEAGLGGSHDATTAVSADVLCFAPIAMDHKDVLGDSLAAIATDKAGAIRSAAPVCSTSQFPQAARVIEAAARKHKAPLIWADAADASLELGLPGPHQKSNAGLALAAWHILAPMLGKDPQDAQAQKRGLALAFIPGRLQYVPATSAMPPFLLDGAHNPHGMTALMAAMRQANIQPAAIVFSCLGDKDWQTAAAMLKKQAGDAPIFVPPLDNPRAANAQDVARFFNATPPATAQAIPDAQGGPTSTSPGASPLAQALAHAAAVARACPGCSGRPVLVTGSLYLLAEFFSLYPAYLSSQNAIHPDVIRQDATHQDANHQDATQGRTAHE
ncbi:cyanophycin synthetase [Desulfovibrio sp. 86]|uniref:Dihydrofolate synthase/folylpolyglutamate synthase n=1 Tax=uncultured Desulfovibrio sp. TaxID=167968 RepID=A0A212L0H9_9BACT|nr:cyanophycin synthetase [Desulfovibrio sp. 86]SCM71035.1 FolC bifunctional protein [uncultured Desulfovibrio sp.]VZH32684.1 FolC bifunctional protein [Desulfovibrio sp. 86]